MKGIQLLGRKTLMLGEAGSGKTQLAATLLQDLMAEVDPEEITVIDFAPERQGDIGGKMTDYVQLDREVRYLSPSKVYAPRLTGDTLQRVVHYAEKNRENMEPLLNQFIQESTPVLIINDVTLYLHRGENQKIVECIQNASTILVTAYQGSKLEDDSGSGISSREKELTGELAGYMDFVMETG